MKRLLIKVDEAVKSTADSWSLPFEPSKTEWLTLRRKGEELDRKNKKYMKWLGVILEEFLQFDLHCKQRIRKARNLLRAFGSIGNWQFGISTQSWHQHYMGMVRTDIYRRNERRPIRLQGIFR